VVLDIAGQTFRVSAIQIGTPTSSALASIAEGQLLDLGDELKQLIHSKLSVNALWMAINGLTDRLDRPVADLTDRWLPTGIRVWGF
jgi:hypothetical protein